MAFILADGREIVVVKGWRGEPAEQDFLREVFVGACRYFTTVLGPGADSFHHDHIHLDLARHDPRGERGICKPMLKFAPRLEPGHRPADPPGSAPARCRRSTRSRREPYDQDQYSAVRPARPTAQAMAPQQTWRAPAETAPFPASPPRPPQRPSVIAAAPLSEPAGRFSADLPMRPPGAVPGAPLALQAPPPPARTPQWLNGHGLY